MDSITQMVLGTLTKKREKVTEGGTVTVDTIPAIMSAILQCPVKDRGCLIEHYAMTLAASDDQLDLVPIYDGLLRLYLTDVTAYDTVNTP